MQDTRKAFASVLTGTMVAFLIYGCGQSHNAERENAGPAGVLTGLWELDSYVGQNPVHSKMALKQEGGEFFGEGSDTSGSTFSIINGIVKGQQIGFFKKYPGTTPTAAAVQYTGKVIMVSEADYQGPYLQGTYVAEVNGRPFSGQWRAQMPDKLIAPPQTNNSAVPSPLPVQGTKIVYGSSRENKNPADRIPDLSGKWKMAYEYDFTTVKTTIFLEQNGHKVAGHGTESDTKRSFVIDNGQYKFPQVIFRIKHIHEGAFQSMLFKGTASVVNDQDYQGTYISGKTQGGGAWEADQVR